MHVSIRRPRFVAALLVAATVAFFLGVTAERPLFGGPSVSSPQPRPTAFTRTAESAEHVACERSGGGEGACAQTGAPAAQSGSATTPAAGSQEGSASQEAVERAGGVGEATILGLPFESPLVIGAVVLVSLALAAAVWLVPGMPWLLVGVALFAFMTGAFDVREIPVQLARGSRLLVTLAALAAALHFAVTYLAAVAARQLPSHRPLPSVVDARGRQGAIDG